MMNAQNKGKQQKKAPERKRNTHVDEAAQAKKQKNNKIITEVQKAQDEIIDTEECIRSTEIDLNEISSNASELLLDVGNYARQIPDFEARKYNIKVNLANIETKLSMTRNDDDLEKHECVVTQNEEMLKRLEKGLDDTEELIQSLQTQGPSGLDDILSLLSNILSTCTIE